MPGLYSSPIHTLCLTAACRSLCEELCATLAFNLPKRPYDHLDAYLTDPECAAVLKQNAQTERIVGEMDPVRRAAYVEKYFEKHHVREFLLLVGEPDSLCTAQPI